MRSRQTLRSRPSANRGLPGLWLVSDARNDGVLDAALRALPRGSGLVFRHYHLTPAERAARFARAKRAGRGHWVIWAGTSREARRAGAAGSYGPASAGPGLRLVTAHSLREIGAANRSGAALILLSPVFSTRSHPGRATLGPVRFLLRARRALAPVIALGGVNRRNARRLAGIGWAAIDGLSH